MMRGTQVEHAKSQQLSIMASCNSLNAWKIR
uniref:Uncharacterized protein n=1 Tax=Siphoviridae sp. ctBLh2 TaxID=2827803 RepID=A0A8S5S3S1_9CAUD|nr:MAG TPA: hypothetical protein [Siphoviridae sp. ctBLh2]DAV17156.1 MAG TPA: hypothetical protein [Caudoviricetes sp.]